MTRAAGSKRKRRSFSVIRICEYNLALGLRRAAEAKRYLAALGIGEDRIEIVTLGEERPSVQGHTEEAWALNRRAEFEVISGG